MTQHQRRVVAMFDDVKRNATTSYTDTVGHITSEVYVYDGIVARLWYDLSGMKHYSVEIRGSVWNAHVKEFKL